MNYPNIKNIPTKVEIQSVHQAIKPYIHQTPVHQSSAINQLVGAEIYFKCENFQKVGAFKMRGATYATLSLSESQKKRGIATHSSGNHAQAIALIAQLQQIKAYIVMPDNTPIIKRKATAAYGAEIIDCAANLQSRIDTLEAVVAETGATFIPSYDDYNIIAGQATAAKELLAQSPPLDTLITPIGGGGLMSGTALAAYYWSPHTQLIGAEPMEADDAFRSLSSGQIQTNATTNTLADGLRTTLSPKTFGIIQQYVSEIIRVSEAEIIAAMRLVWERMKLLIEPSSAVPLAAIIQQKKRFQNQKIGLILSGGNIDIDNLPF